MNDRAQILVIAAILLSLGLLILAVAVDGGRLYLEQVRLERSAQAAADAGIGVAAEQVVTLAAARQTEAALAPACAAPPPAACTPTPPPFPVEAWLSDTDRESLVSAAMQAQVESVAMNYAERNGLGPETTFVDYPFDHQPQDAVVRVRVRTGRQLEILLAGLLDPDWVRLEAAAISTVPQR
jgi:hypothetical protein